MRLVQNIKKLYLLDLLGLLATFVLKYRYVIRNVLQVLNDHLPDLYETTIVCH